MLLVYVYSTSEQNVYSPNHQVLPFFMSVHSQTELASWPWCLQARTLLKSGSPSSQPPRSRSLWKQARLLHSLVVDVSTRLCISLEEAGTRVLHSLVVEEGTIICISLAPSDCRLCNSLVAEGDRLLHSLVAEEGIILGNSLAPTAIRLLHSLVAAGDRLLHSLVAVRARGYTVW